MGNEKEDWRVEAGRKGAAARKTRSNQYKTGRVNVEDMRARIKVGIMLSKLEKDAIGGEKLTEGQRASIKLLLDKAMPTLQAVEQTTLEPAATKSEAEIYSELLALLSANPEMRAQVKAILDQPQADVH
jgi:hypothetical protein